MSARRGVALAVVGWVVVVAIGTGLVWAVVSRAGEGVTEEPDALPDASGTVASAPDTGPSDASPSRSTRQTPTSGRTSAGTPPSSPSAPAAPPPTTSVGAEAVHRTWQGDAGVVSVECRETTIRLTGAAPNSGYSVELDDTGPDDVRVDLESADGDRRTRVEAVCAGGTPVFAVDQDD